VDSCGNISKISAYHDGELPPAEAQRLEAHLRECQSCRRELQRLRALSAWLSSVPAPRVPRALLDRLRREVRPRRDRVVLRTAEALAAGAAAVLLVCSALLWQGADGGATTFQPPADWETAAVTPAAAAAATSNAAPGISVEDEPDVQLARSILGSVLSEGEQGYE